MSLQRFRDQSVGVINLGVLAEVSAPRWDRAEIYSPVVVTVEFPSLFSISFFFLLCLLLCEVHSGARVHNFEWAATAKAKLAVQGLPTMRSKRLPAGLSSMEAEGVKLPFTNKFQCVENHELPLWGAHYVAVFLATVPVQRLHLPIIWHWHYSLLFSYVFSRFCALHWHHIIRK